MSTTVSILLIDDDAGSRLALCSLLKQAGYGAHCVASGEDALDWLDQNTAAIVITDLMLPGMDGLEILRRVKERAPDTNVILITGNASAHSALEAMKNGAFDYITKPLNAEKLKIIIAKALETQHLLKENAFLRQQLRARYSFTNIIGTSPAMQQLFARMEKIASTDSSLLILGESGTGKELVARAIHFNGPRKDRPFVALNCSAIPAELLESELFGHMRGSFTGAIANKMGKFELANGGTIFLDEIGTMPVHLQLKLLRVLQEQEIEPVGGNHRIKLNVRVISATNADLEEMIVRGQFREDLFYRLNVIPLTLPPLRQRREDIALLSQHFLRKSCQALQRDLVSLDPTALQILEGYNWPGNVRELENIMERMVALCDGSQINVQDLPAHICGARQASLARDGLQNLPEDGINMPQLLRQLENRWIRQALQRSAGVKAQAAALLGINRTTLVEKMRRLGL